MKAKDLEAKSVEDLNKELHELLKACVFPSDAEGDSTTE
jgi:hypothetical protein